MTFRAFHTFSSEHKTVPKKTSREKMIFIFYIFFCSRFSQEQSRKQKFFPYKFQGTEDRQKNNMIWTGVAQKNLYSPLEWNEKKKVYNVHDKESEKKRGKFDTFEGSAGEFWSKFLFRCRWLA